MNFADKSARKNLLVVDIETVPDIDVAYNLLKLSRDEDFSTEELRTKIRNYHLEITDGKNDFPRQLFHNVVCISFLEAKIEYLEDQTEVYHLTKLDSASTQNSSEKDLIKWFWDYGRKIRPKIISFNGRTFDIPVLKYRAMKYDISCDWFFKDGDKWNNYNSGKYSIDMHCDLLDVFSDFGSSAKIKMAEACALFNIPCKIDVDGSQVSELYDKNDFESIRGYCETDVIATYILYLKHIYTSGRMTKENFKYSLNQLQLLISESKKEAVRLFHNEWNF